MLETADEEYPAVGVIGPFGIAPCTVRLVGGVAGGLVAAGDRRVWRLAWLAGPTHRLCGLLEFELRSRCLVARRHVRVPQLLTVFIEKGRHLKRA